MRTKLNLSENKLKNQNFWEKPALSKTDFSRCFGIAVGIALLFFKLQSPLQAFETISFEEGFLDYNLNLTKKRETYKSLYNTYLDNLEIGEKYIIPKIIHAVWLGSELPAHCKALIDTWRKLHPDWTVKVWTDLDVIPFKLHNKFAFYNARNYGEKSDIFRYEILYRYGGMYIDTDFECLKSFDEIHQSCEFYAGLGYSEEVLIGIIGSVPGHPILKACIDNLHIGNGDNDLWRILMDTGPIYFTDIVLANAAAGTKGKVVIFPPSYFYPVPNYNIDDYSDHERLREEFIYPESRAVHWWSVSWMKNLPN